VRARGFSPLNRVFVTLVGLVLMGVVIAACSKTAAPSETPEPTREPTAAEGATRPVAPTVTETPPQTATPPTTPIPTPEASKQVLIQYAWCCGDGVSDVQLFFLGYAAPRFILYVDGQLVIREGRHSNLYQQPGDESWGEGYTFAETTLPEAEMCDLLERIADAGFFEIAEDAGNVFEPSPALYTFDTEHGWPPFGEGSPNPSIVVNGDPAGHVTILDDWLDYLQPGMAGVYDMLDTYRPPGLVPYTTDRVALFIGRGSEPATDDEAGEPWPADLPSLADLYAEAGPFGADSVDDGERSILVEGEPVPALLGLFDNRMRGQQFTDGEWNYYVIARPLLPHETAEILSQPWLVNPEFVLESFTLPFDCEE
jgi:hypothetical protein